MKRPRAPGRAGRRPGWSSPRAPAARTAGRQTRRASARRPRRRTTRAGPVMTLLAQGVAGAAHRAQQPRLPALLELLPQVPDVDRYDIVVFRLAFPDRLQQVFTRQDLAGVSHEVLQEIELGRREAHRSRAAPRAAAWRFQQQVGESKMVLRA